MNPSRLLLNFESKDFSLVPSVSLARDLQSKLGEGHQWIFHDALSEGPKNYKGPSLLKFKNKLIAVGAYDSSSELRFRFLSWLPMEGNEFLKRWKLAIKRRHQYLDKNERLKTNSFRLIFGEGDDFPGIVIDIFANIAVIQLDRPWLKKIWNLEAWIKLIREDLPFIEGILLKSKTSAKENEGEESEVLFGDVPENIEFKENHIIFKTKIRDAAKTGFFLDQRDNRLLIEKFTSGCRVINFFSYTGGFSVFAARGGASEVISVDIAKAAIDNCEEHFVLNKLNTKRTHVCADAFEYLELMKKKKEKFDLVIIDPPSFAPNAKAKENAMKAYEKCFAMGAELVSRNGLLALSSCSGHVSLEDFGHVINASVSKAKRRAKIIAWGHQPSDHPYPLAMKELHYLKFCLLELG